MLTILLSQKTALKSSQKILPLQVAALPTPYISKESVPASVIEEEKRIFDAAN